MSQHSHSWAEQSHDGAYKARKARVCVCVCVLVCEFECTTGWRTTARWSLGRCRHSSFTVFSWASLHTQISWLPEAVQRAKNWEMTRTIGLEAQELTHYSLSVRVYNKLRGSSILKILLELAYNRNHSHEIHYVVSLFSWYSIWDKRLSFSIFSKCRYRFPLWAPGSKYTVIASGSDQTTGQIPCYLRCLNVCNNSNVKTNNLNSDTLQPKWPYNWLPSFTSNALFHAAV